MEPWQAQKMTQTWNDALSPMDLQDGKEYFGCSPVRIQTPYVNPSQKENYPPNSNMPPANKRKGTPQALSTGNFAWRSSRRSLLPQLQACLEEESTPSCPAQPPQLPTVTNLNQDSPSLLNLGPNPFDETQEPTGTQYGPPPSPGIWTLSQPMSVWCLIVPCALSDPTTPIVEECLEQFSCFGVLRARANLTVHGVKQELTLILSVQDPSSGTVIRINRMLWSMNFEAVLIKVNLRNRCRAPFTLDRPLPCTCRDQGLFQTT